jgi:hypothetical protein
MIAAGGMYAADFAVAKMDTLIAVLIKTMSSVLDNMCTLYAAKKAAGGVPSCGGSGDDAVGRARAAFAGWIDALPRLS